jgi:hypothetical protein
MKTLIISATKAQSGAQSILMDSVTPLQHKNVSVTTEFICNNTRGLSTVYNEKLKQHGKDYECIVFAHDDVYIDDAFFIDKIKDGFDYGYDIVGVAGGINPVIKTPTLWHLMCGRENLRGAAGHFSEDMTNIFMTSFGPCNSRVTVLDGLFLAVNTKTVIPAGWKFNENYDFHLYDVASCLDANKLKLKMGVLPIHIIHKSHGLRSLEDPCFVKNQAKFIQEYAAS